MDITGFAFRPTVFSLRGGLGDSQVLALRDGISCARRPLSGKQRSWRRGWPQSCQTVGRAPEPRRATQGAQRWRSSLRPGTKPEDVCVQCV